MEMVIVMCIFDATVIGCLTCICNIGELTIHIWHPHPPKKKKIADLLLSGAQKSNWSVGMLSIVWLWLSKIEKTTWWQLWEVERHPRRLPLWQQYNTKKSNYPTIFLNQHTCWILRMSMRPHEQGRRSASFCRTHLGLFVSTAVMRVVAQMHTGNKPYLYCQESDQVRKLR